jgi:hypothetical protein
MPISSPSVATVPPSAIQVPTPVVNHAATTQTLESLQAQIAEQGQQLGVLQAQRRVVQNQLNTTAPGGARNALDAQLQSLDAQIGKLQVDMAGTRAQFAGRLGIPTERVGLNGRVTYPTVPDFGFRRGPDPDAVVGMSFALAIAIALPLSIAYARRIWKGKPTAAAATESVAPRLDRLEQAVDAIAIEIERVAEGQRFVTKVLADRPVVVQPQPQPAADPLQRESAASVGQEKPFLALGAGPIEPIRVAERQAVRQSITPH